MHTIKFCDDKTMEKEQNTAFGKFWRVSCGFYIHQMKFNTTSLKSLSSDVVVYALKFCTSLCYRSKMTLVHDM
jgi:hypothetical protein